MASQKGRAKRGVYKVRNGRRMGTRAEEDQRLRELERETERCVAAMEALRNGEPVDIDAPLLAMRKLAEEAPDRARLESRLFARHGARWRIEDAAARAFLSGTLSA